MLNNKNPANNLLHPLVIEYSEKELDAVTTLPTIAYRNKIADICNDLSKVNGIKYYYLLISTNFSKSLCLGNTPHWSLTYHKYRLGRLDVGINPADDQYHILTESIQKDFLINLFYQWFEAYGIYETYSIIRQSEDVKIIAIAHNDHLIKNPTSYYENTVDAFEDFTITFIDNMLEIIVECCPALALTTFIKDAEYRKDIIKRKSLFINPILSPREKEILLYAFHGYTSKEIAKIIPIDNRTIEKYTANARRKLGARNITHAIKKAVDLGIIGK